MKLISLFTGIGAYERALKNNAVEYDLVKFCEVDKFAVQSYCAIHGESAADNLGDIQAVNPSTLPEVDLVTFSYPCFTADTLVLTSTGYKKITDVEVGDHVLTHNNVYKEVTEVHNNGVHELMRVKVACTDDLQCTPNHKFYCRERSWEWDADRRTDTRRFTTPEWKCAKDFTKDTYIGYAINQNSIVPEWEGVDIRRWRTVKHQQTLDMNDPQLWYLVGRYLGDGWLKNGDCKTPSGVYICCGKHKVEDFISKIHPDLHYWVDAARTVDKFVFSNKELAVFMSKFGHHADGKYIPGFVMDMPVNLLKELIQGYFDSDGYLSKAGVYKISSINRTLLYGVGQLITKVYHCPVSMSAYHRNPTCVIEGRTVNQKEYSYEIRFKPNDAVNRRINFYEDGYVWYSVRGTETIEQDTVYDLTVEDDHSFTANGLIVHNCTDLSLAGKQRGFFEDNGDVSRSGLFFSAADIIASCRPKFAISENVASLTLPKFKTEFDLVKSTLEDAGYHNYWTVLNAKDFGLPQHRERMFMVSVREDIDHGFVFPKGNSESGCIADILEPEENVNAKHYLKPSRLEKLLWYNPFKNFEGIVTAGSLETGHQRDRIYSTEGLSGTLTATDYKQPKQIDVRGRVQQIAKLESHRDNPNQYRVYDAEGLSPTLTTMGGGGRQPHVPINGGVRRFTPLECFRLMGFKDEDYRKCVEAGVSDSQMYRQAGNSICVNVLEAIFDELSIQYPREFV